MMQMDFTQAVGWAISLLGIFTTLVFGLVKLLLAQFEKRLDARFAVQEKEIEQIVELERSFLRFKPNSPSTTSAEKTGYVTKRSSNPSSTAWPCASKTSNSKEPTMIDPAKARRESLRWFVLITLNTSRPIDPHEAVVLSTIQGIYPDATAQELRRELDYLADRQLVTIQRQPSGPWIVGLTHYGVDVAEYTVECHPGIARPEKYWSA